MDKETKRIIDTLHGVKERYAMEGLKIVGIFGSFATGLHDRFSDVDIAYEIDLPRFSRQYPDGFSKLFRLQEIKESLQALLHKKVDLVSMRSGDRAFIDHIKNEMIYV
jgi:predicted nucleotidyltransferase